MSYASLIVYSVFIVYNCLHCLTMSYATLIVYSVYIVLHFYPRLALAIRL